MPHIPNWCGICKSHKVRYYCDTENRYTCLMCHDFCTSFNHKWKETEDVPIEGGKQES